MAKIVRLVPSVCEGSDVYEGFIEMRKPSFDEKFDIIEASGVKMSSEGQMESVNHFEHIRKLVKASKPFYSSVDIRNKNTGEEYKSFDDLSCEDDLHGVLTEMAVKLLQGFKMGNG